MDGMETSLLRRLPAVGRLLDDPALGDAIRLYGRDAVKVQAQREIETLRRKLAGPEPRVLAERRIAELPRRVAEGLRLRLGTGLRRVINATGIFLHTNLGRAPLPRPVAEELLPILSGHCDLEMDLASGRRNDRNVRVRKLLTELTGAEAALVVNNNAGALVLALAALAAGRQVVVSRGELVEIGGSFRIPDILAAAGAELVEVGTTNRTRLADYERAIGPQTALLLKVHTSNYRIVGFTAAVESRELAALGGERGIPLLVDEGSGLMRRSSHPQLGDHPGLRQLVTEGCDLVCGSGDKVLGGPQAGLVVGRRELVERLGRHPLYRALRPDRFTFAALEAVLRRHLAGGPMPCERLWVDGAEHRRRLERVAELLQISPPAPQGALPAEIVDADAFIGGGTAPEAPIPGEALALPGDDRLLLRLRTGDPPVVGYLRAGRLVLDLRTVEPADDELLVAALGVARDDGP